MYNFLSNGNTKLSAEGAFNFGIPAGKTCPAKGTCAAGCYAIQGFFSLLAVKAAQERRLELSKGNTFISVISSELKKRKITKLRIHDSGDFYSLEYLNKWLAIIQDNPSVKFHAYTKMIPLFAGRILPSNFTVIYSFGGKFDAMINTAKDRHSQVFSSLKDLRKSKYANASKKDSVASGKNNKIGLVYHGAKSKAWVTARINK